MYVVPGSVPNGRTTAPATDGVRNNKKGLPNIGKAVLNRGR
jgi:hypothetical protein